VKETALPGETTIDIVDRRPIIDMVTKTIVVGVMDISLTNREADVMRVLWELGPSVVAEVRDQLLDELAYTTVLTILRTLETKGYVGHEEEGRVHRYFPQIDQQAAQKSALQHLKHKLFSGSAELLFTHLISDQKLSSVQLRRMRKLLTRKADEGEA
jgi:predicted transcriptional regulator